MSQISNYTGTPCTRDATDHALVMSFKITRQPADILFIILFKNTYCRRDAHLLYVRAVTRYFFSAVFSENEYKKRIHV
jgi:hypothetical protein